ncbi:hypothetical protein [Varibaculum cambriense]
MIDLPDGLYVGVGVNFLVAVADIFKKKGVCHRPYQFGVGISPWHLSGYR